MWHCVSMKSLWTSIQDTGLLVEVNKCALAYMFVNLTGSPDARSRRWASTVYALMPFPKQFKDRLAFMIHDCALHLIHTGVPVLCLQSTQIEISNLSPYDIIVSTYKFPF